MAAAAVSAFVETFLDVVVVAGGDGCGRRTGFPFFCFFVEFTFFFAGLRRVLAFFFAMMFGLMLMAGGVTNVTNALTTISLGKGQSTTLWWQQKR